jgi:hypothetical protein
MSFAGFAAKLLIDPIDPRDLRVHPGEVFG